MNSQQRDRLSSRLSSTACYRCRGQKRKCSRDLPVCRRCREFEALCQYPLPPNRRMLASDRFWSRKHNSRRSSSLTHTAIVLQDDKRLDLLRSYFAQFIHSHILFDRKILLRNLQGRNVPDILLRCLLAFSSILTPREIVPSQLNPHASNAHPLNDHPCPNVGIGDSSWLDPWALEENLDIPLQGLPSSVESLLASFHLSMYWFARGHLNRARSTADLAFQMSHDLIQQGHTDAIQFSPQSALSTFGIYWFIRCFIQETGCVNSETVLELPDKPALSAVREITRCTQEGRISHSDLGDECDMKDNVKFLALMGCWFRVRKFVVCLRTVDDSIKMISTLTQLDIETTNCYDSFAHETTDPKDSSHTKIYKSLTAEILYHQCRVVSQLFFLVCNMRTTRAEHEFIQSSATIAVRHSLSLTEAINRLFYITSSEQIGSIPPFIGYAAFITASVQLGSLVYLCNIHAQSNFPHEIHLLVSLRSCVLSNLSALDQLRPLWASVRTLWDKLMALAPLAAVSMQNIGAFHRQCPSIPIIDQITMKELPALLSSQFSQILSIIDLFEPFYLPVEKTELENITNNYSARSWSSQVETTRCMEPDISLEIHPDEHGLFSTDTDLGNIWHDIF